MMMKRLVAILALNALIFTMAHAQSAAQQAKDRAAADANANVGSRIDRTVDGAFDKTGKAIGGLFKKKKKAPAANTNTDASNNTTNTNSNQGAGANGAAIPANGVAFSDFVPGQSIIFQDDFSLDALADFPAKWNSNGSGKVSTVNGLNGRWLELKTNTAVTPEINKPLPENATIEFDLYMDAQGGQTTPFIQFGLTQVKDILKEDMFYKNRLFMNIYRYSEQDGHAVEYGLKNDVLGTKGDFPITSYSGKVLHVSMALNKTRIRIYLDQTKVLDLPRALTPRNAYQFLFK